MSERRWRDRAIALVAGLVLALTQPPLSLAFCVALGIPVLFWLWSQAASGRGAFFIGWYGGIGYFGASLSWIVEPFLIEPEKFAFLIPVALVGMAGGMALFWGAGFWVANRLGTRNWAAPFALAFGWAGMEWLRGNILSGFPWSLIGYAWVETAAMQVAADIGIYGVTLLTILGGALLGRAAIGGALWWRLGTVGIVVAVFFAASVIGSNRLLGAGLSTLKGGQADRPLIGLIQPNVAQQDKWQPALREVHLQDLLDRTRRLSDGGADIVIWPEAATPYQIDKAPNLRAMIARSLKPGGVLLAGAVRFEGAKAFNSLIAVDATGTVLDIYDKQHLVPFGEVLPLEDLLSKIGLRAMISLPGGFTPGAARDRSMTVPGAPPFVPMICYEAIFPAEVMRRGGAGAWMVQVTNDAWFGRLIGPYQHLAMARVRAIERGLPLARAANTGVSAVIDPFGRLLASLDLNKPGEVLHALPQRRESTLYGRVEDLPFSLGLLICLFFSLLGRRGSSPF